MSAAEVKWTAGELMQRLHRHYIKPGELYPGGVLIPECGWNGTAGVTRCDALYVGFTGTSGRLLRGHEIKVSRADWRTELAKPGKADGWAEQCHEWWVVAPSTDVVPVEELPDGWGLLVPGRSKTRMDVKVKARTHAERTPSWHAVRSVLARYDTLRAQAISAGRQQAREDVDRQVQEALARRHPRTATALSGHDQQLLAGAQRLHTEFGVDLAGPWHECVRPEQLAAALKIAQALETLPARYDRTHAGATAARAVKAFAELDRVLAQIPALLEQAGGPA